MLVYILYFGISNYLFYEKSLKKIIFQLLNDSPLKEFQDKGFMLDEDDKLNGTLNGYNVILIPMANSSYEKYLTILIPIQPKDDLEKYRVKFDEYSRISVSGEVLFLQAAIKNYKKDYDFAKLYNLLQNTTELVIERGIKPLKIIED